MRTISDTPAAAAAAAAKSIQSCPTLCDTIDGSPPGSPIPGILQARTTTTKNPKQNNKDGKGRRKLEQKQTNDLNYILKVYYKH